MVFGLNICWNSHSYYFVSSSSQLPKVLQLILCVDIKYIDCDCIECLNRNSFLIISGYLGPAGLHNDNAFPSHCVGGATGYVDRLIFGIHHIHNRPTSKKLYGSGAFDPEGALGVLTSILHIMLGIQAGNVMLTYKIAKSRVIRLLLWSVVCGVGGFVLCGGIANSGLIPVNKNLW